jgi:hypothetical protein
MSASPSEADIGAVFANVSFGPITDSCVAAIWVSARAISACALASTLTEGDLFDHLVGSTQQCNRKAKAERLGGFEIDDQFSVG